MSELLSAVVSFTQAPAALDPIGDWGRKIVEVYMNWYTFFVTTNFAIMGYVFTKNPRFFDERAIRLLAGLFVLLNVLGSVSTITVGLTVSPTAPQNFRALIKWAALSNTVGLLSNALLWSYIVYSRRKRRA